MIFSDAARHRVHFTFGYLAVLLATTVLQHNIP